MGTRAVFNFMYFYHGRCPLFQITSGSGMKNIAVYYVISNRLYYFGRKQVHTNVSAPSKNVWTARNNNVSMATISNEITKELS